MNQENWKITHDASCWTVYEKRIAGADSKNPGEVLWAGRSFHATPEQACLSLLNRLIAQELEDREMDLTGHLETVLQAIEAAQMRIHDVCRTWAQSGAKAA